MGVFDSIQFAKILVVPKVAAECGFPQPPTFSRKDECILIHVRRIRRPSGLPSCEKWGINVQIEGAGEI